MKTISCDTHPETEQFHIELIRKAPVFRRLQVVNSLVKTTRQLSWQGICERYPAETEQERMRRFVSLLYGNESLTRQIMGLLAKEEDY